MYELNLKPKFRIRVRAVLLALTLKRGNPPRNPAGTVDLFVGQDSVPLSKAELM
jgi:hypothetical protein